MEQTTKTIVIKIDASQAVAGGREAQRALEAIEKQTRVTADSVQKMESGFDTAALVSKLVAGAYVVKEFADKIIGVYTAARDAASGISDFAEQLGVSTDFIQGSMLAAAQHTVSIDKLGTAYTKASQLIGQASQGQKGAIDTFDQMGVKILGAAGKLRSTESILQDSAAALLKIDDPARRVAISMDLFGKSGAQVIPMLSDLAGGADALAIKARAVGAVIEKDTIEALSKLKANAEEGSLKWNALVANIGAPIATWAMEAVNKILGDILANLDRLKRLRAEESAGLPAAKSDVQNVNDQIAAQEGLLRINPNNFSVKASLNGPNGLYARRDALQWSATTARQVVMEGEESAARSVPLPVVDSPPGVANPAVKDGSAESQTERLRKLTDTLNAAAAAQTAMTAAARKGDVAFIEQQASADATAKAIEAFGGKVSAADPKVKALAETLQKPIFDKLQGAAAQAFVVATTELEKQNDLLDLQNRLLNEAPEVQAREIALLKSKQEAQKAGNALTVEDIENRRQAIEQNETLKQQADQLKKAQELWTEPLKQALRNIQTIGADAFDKMLESGNFSFQSLAQSFTATLRRMAAEFLALATIRPVMSVLVSGLVGGGMVSPAMAGQLGFPSTPGLGGQQMQQGTTGLGSIFGGGGGFGGTGGFGSIFNNSGGGGGWLGRQIGGVGDFFNMPIGSIFGSAVPAGGYADVGALLGSGNTGASAAASGMGGIGGVSIGQGIGGIAGIGSGIYQLANSKGTGSTIAGISSIAAGIMAFTPLAPFAPFLALGGNLLGGIIGDAKQIPPMPELSYANGDFRPNGVGFDYFGDSLNGGTDNKSVASSMGQQVLDIFRKGGLKVNAGKLIGGQFATGVAHMWNGDQWANSPYTESGLFLPGGGYERLTQNDTSGDYKSQADLLTTRVITANIMRGGVDASATLKSGIRGINPGTVADVQNVIDMAAAYDKLGKAANPVKDSIDKINDSFSDLTAFATKAGLALEPINAEIEKQTKRSAQDFIDSMLDPLAAQMRALADERDVAIESAQYIKDHIEGVYVDMDRVATYYTNKEAALRDQFYQGAVSNLQALIQRMTYGDLANASPVTSLAGTKATYMSTLAQARAGVSSAISSLPGIAETYTNTARNYFASSPEYAALVEQIRRDLSEVMAVATGGATTGAGSAQQINQAVQVQMAANDQLREMVQTLAEKVDKLSNDNAVLVAQLRAQTTNRM